MKNVLRFCLLLLLISISINSKAQILISLLFGDALNSDKIEFGLTGGLNHSWILDIEESSGMSNFHLGFYFHINMFENSFLSTGVLVKSNVGAQGMSTYPIGDPEFDNVYGPGELEKQINYFYVPVLWHQRINNRFFLEGGLQLGLRGRAYDIFHLEDAYEGELAYKRDIRDEIKALDSGLLAGVGYKFNKEIKSIAVGVKYYYGWMDVSKLEDLTIRNSSIYIYMKIPIGTGSKKENAPKD
jgi:hypothetical protein